MTKQALGGDFKHIASSLRLTSEICTRYPTPENSDKDIAAFTIMIAQISDDLKQFKSELQTKINKIHKIIPTVAVNTIAQSRDLIADKIDSLDLHLHPNSKTVTRRQTYCCTTLDFS